MELKPCPFCGHSPSISHFQTRLNSPVFWQVQCDCNVMMHTCDQDAICDCDQHHCGQGWPAEVEAVAAWNARPVDDACAEKRRDLRIREALLKIAETEPDEMPDGTILGSLVLDCYEMAAIARSILAAEW